MTIEDMKDTAREMSAEINKILNLVPMPSGDVITLAGFNAYGPTILLSSFGGNIDLLNGKMPVSIRLRWTDLFHPDNILREIGLPS